MNWAVDTNVLLRATDVGNPSQVAVQSAIETLRLSGESPFIFPQNLMEFWAVATRPLANNGLGLSVSQVESQIKNLKTMFVLLDDKPEVTSIWEDIVVRYQVLGKQAHDAHLVAAMVVHGVTNLLTFNVADFKRYSEITVIHPQTISKEETK